MKNEFIVVKDKEGILRPFSGMWRNDELGKLGSEDYKLQEGDSLVVVELTEKN